MCYEVKTAYFGCDCLDLNHVISFVYSPPDKYDNGFITITLKSNMIYNEIFPPIFKFNKYAWGYYLNFNILNRVSIAFNYVFLKCKQNKSIFDTILLTKNNIPEINKFLSNFTNEIKESFSICLIDDNNDFQLLFKKEDFIECSINLPHHTFKKRIKIALKYIFGEYNNEEQYFEINKEQASMLRGFLNKEII